MGLINMISGVVTAAAAVVNVIQNMHMETSLNAIELNTRRGTLFLGDRGDGGILGQLFKVVENTGFTTTNTDDMKTDIFWSLKKLESIDTRLADVGKADSIFGKINDSIKATFPMLRDIKNAVGDVKTAVNSIHIEVTAGPGAEEIAEAIGDALTTQGALATA